MIKYFGVLGLSLLGGSISAYVVGYERLYNPQTNVIVDILHDAHLPEHILLGRNVEEWPFSLVKSELYQTEQRVLDALELLNRNTPGMVDVIWEDGNRYDRRLFELINLNFFEKKLQFISGCECLVRRQFCNLNVISSDMCRPVFMLLVLAHAGIEKEIDGMSFRNLIPVSDGDMAIILSQYGDETWHAFDQLREQTTSSLAKKWYGQEFSKESMNGLFDLPFIALTDCEMLRNILSSHKPHVFLYCGGAHAKGISEFLIKHAGFKRIGGKVDGPFVGIGSVLEVLKKKNDEWWQKTNAKDEVLKKMDARDLAVFEEMLAKDLYKEIETKELALLDEAYRTTAWRSTYTGSTYSAL
jgi:hypothetical protein